MLTSTADEEDFNGTTQVITFQPGESSKTVSIPIVNDDIAECDEEFGGQLALPEKSQNLKVSISTVLSIVLQRGTYGEVGSACTHFHQIVSGNLHPSLVAAQNS